MQINDETIGERTTVAQAVTGHLDGVDEEGRVLFRPDGTASSFPVVIGLPAGDAEVVKAAWLGRRVLVLRVGGDEPTWILTGFLRERVGTAARDAAPGELTVQMDGEIIRIQGKERLELICGRARLVLDSNGHVELSGSHVVTRSRGPVKIKGTSIDLN